MNEEFIIKTYRQGINSVIALVKDMDGKILDLTEQVVLLGQEVTDLTKSNQKLNVRITELESRLKKNSSKPPSSDGLKKKTRNMRERTGKPTGGQPGHEGRTLEKVKNPDEVVDIKPKKCECGCCLSDIKGTARSRQVIEMPAIQG